MRHTRNRQVAKSRKVNYFVKGNNMEMEHMQKFHRSLDKSFMWIRTQYKKSYPMRNYYCFKGQTYARNIK